MTAAHVILIALAAISTGSFTGLLMTTLAFFQRALEDLSGPEFALVMQRFLGWKPESPLDDWRKARDRYFRINGIRGLGSGAAFVLFLAALALA